MTGHVKEVGETAGEGTVTGKGVVVTEIEEFVTEIEEVVTEMEGVVTEMEGVVTEKEGVVTEKEAVGTEKEESESPDGAKKRRTVEGTRVSTLKRISSI